MPVYLDVEGDESSEEKPGGLGRVEKIFEKKINNRITVAVAFLVRKYWGPIVPPFGTPLVRVPSYPDDYFPIQGLRCSLDTLKRWLSEDIGTHTVFFKGTADGIINPSRMGDESSKVKELALQLQVVTDALDKMKEDYMRLLGATQKELDKAILPDVERLERLFKITPQSSSGSTSKKSVKALQKELDELKKQKNEEPDKDETTDEDTRSVFQATREKWK